MVATTTPAVVAVDDAATSRGIHHPPGDWPNEQARFLNRAALLSGTSEACGLILGEATPQGLLIHRLTHCENHAVESERRFQVPAQHLMEWDRRARDQGLQIIGSWHSHPDGCGAPSQADLEGLPAGWLGLIVIPAPDGLPRLHPYGKAGQAPDFVHG